MTMIKFLVWFILGLIITTALVSLIKNPFIIGVIVAFVLGFLGARD